MELKITYLFFIIIRTSLPERLRRSGVLRAGNHNIRRAVYLRDKRICQTCGEHKQKNGGSPHSIQKQIYINLFKFL